MCLLPLNRKCSLKLSLDLFLVLYTGLLTHEALNALVEAQGLGRSLSLGSMGGRSPPSQKIYNCFHFIKLRTMK